MHVITYQALKTFFTSHPGSRQPLDAWYDRADESRWDSILDVRRHFPHADAVKVASGRIVTVFNIGGNKYRLVAAIHYNTRRVYVLYILTHREYDLEKWKETL